MRRLALVSLTAVLMAPPSTRADDSPDCVAWNDDATFAANVTSIAVTRAIRLDIGPGKGSLAVSEARLFTGLVTGTSHLALHAHDSNQNAPAAELAAASFTVKTALDWQGAVFPTPVTLEENQTYWLTWKAPVGAQMPWSLPKSYSGHYHRISYDGGQSWTSQVFQSNASHFKVRLRGACGCATSLITIGHGCAGSTGLIPRLLPSHCPAAGQSLSVSLVNGLGGAWSVLAFGAAPGQLALTSDCNLLVNPLVGPLIVEPLAGTGPGAGQLTLGAMFPASSHGETISIQAFVVDAGVPRGFSASAGLQLTIP